MYFGQMVFSYPVSSKSTTLGFLGNHRTSRYLPARIPVDGEWKSSYTQSRDDCVGVTVDKVRCPHTFYGGGRGAGYAS